MKNYIFKLLSLVILVALFFTGVSQVNAYTNGKFGSEPFADVEKCAASYSDARIGLTPNYLAALMIAVTYHEAGNGNLNNTPSPMALGRGDFIGIKTGNENLYSFREEHSSKARYIRAHFNPGVGLWQLDTSGLGQGIETYKAINTDFSAEIVARNISDLYKNSSRDASDKQKRLAAWKPWAACTPINGVSKCETTFNEIYNESKDEIYISEDTTVKRAGGMVTTTCGFSMLGDSWTCYKYDPDRAQGYTGSFYYTPYEGSLRKYGDTTNNSPFPLTFYTFAFSGSPGEEYRYWTKNHTGYDQTIYKFRSLNRDARSNENWRFDNFGFYGN